MFSIVDEPAGSPCMVAAKQLEALQNPWERARLSLDLKDPLPRFRDLRHAREVMLDTPGWTFNLLRAF